MVLVSLTLVVEFRLSAARTARPYAPRIPYLPPLVSVFGLTVASKVVSATILAQHALLGHDNPVPFREGSQPITATIGWYPACSMDLIVTFVGHHKLAYCDVVSTTFVPTVHSNSTDEAAVAEAP